VHEIKHDGYRIQVRRQGDAIRLFTRRGLDWSARYPAIAVAAVKLRASSFTLDGEAVVCGPDGLALGHASGDANVRAYWCLWTFGGNIVDKNDKVIINSPEIFFRGLAPAGHPSEAVIQPRPIGDFVHQGCQGRREPT
jgi:hypothetical protein